MIGWETGMKNRQLGAGGSLRKVDRLRMDMRKIAHRWFEEKSRLGLSLWRHLMLVALVFVFATLFYVLLALRRGQ